MYIGSTGLLIMNSAPRLRARPQARAVSLASKDQILAALTLVGTGWAYVLNRRLPTVVDAARDRADRGRRNLEYNWPLARVVERHEVDDVRLGVSV